MAQDSGTAPSLAEGLLSGKRLLRALRDERIFLKGTWDENRIKGAGYELTLADDWGAAHERPGSAVVVSATPDGPNRIPTFILDPGDTAIVASRERFCLDFDLTASIGPKFRWAAKGLQVLHGSTAHPGYGRTLKTSGWMKKADERLYMVVVNIGPERITLNAGDPLVYVQFAQVERLVPDEPIKNIGFEDLSRRFLQADGQGMSYYRTLNDLRVAVQTIEDRTQEAQAATRARISTLEALVHKTSSSVELVVVFGVFLISATIFGVVYVSIVEAVKSIPATATGDQLTLVRWLTFSFGALVAVTLTAVIVRLWSLTRPTSAAEGTTKTSQSQALTE